MSMPRIKVTVIKKISMREIHGEVGAGAVDTLPPVCDLFNVGDSFVLDGSEVPKGFCVGAFVDIWRWAGALLNGASFHWMGKEGTMVACCTDGLRPVVFRLERID